MTYANEKKDFLKNILENFSKLEGDGHMVMRPAYYTDLGFDAELVESCASMTPSDEVGVVPNQLGVKNLTFLGKCVSIVSPEFSSNALGRGFAARQYLAEITRVANALGFEKK